MPLPPPKFIIFTPYVLISLYLNLKKRTVTYLKKTVDLLRLFIFFFCYCKDKSLIKVTYTLM